MKKINKLKMLWPYDPENKTTWKYIDCKIVGTRECDTLDVERWIPNPAFKYADLDTPNC